MRRTWREWVRGVARSFARSPCISVLAAASLFAAPLSAQAKIILAHPAFWTVHSRTATVYLLGSVHLLPPNVRWRTPEIDQAMNKADTFYFEMPIDIMSVWDVVQYVRWHSTLPDGTTLRALLDKPTLADYNRALSLAHMSADALDDKRPWFAAQSLGLAYAQRMHYRLIAGVDMQIWQFAKENGRTLRAFETPQQQLDLMVPKDPKLEMVEFDAAVRDIDIEHEKFDEITTAWCAGDAQKIGTLINAAYDRDPQVRKIFVDDRNRNWMKRFDFILSGSGIGFVTVGAGHLTGPNGVPALLRARGYKVNGP